MNAEQMQDRIERLESALRVLYVWAKMDVEDIVFSTKALVPEHVLALCGKALGKKMRGEYE